MDAEKENKEKAKDIKENIDTPMPPQRIDPRKKMKEQDKGGKDRNKGK
ncbi:MAG: hypothetical protein M3512_02855 [Bacteroidota bacterium]|nr:hypothetical protein [Bacteroidota bacterium]